MPILLHSKVAKDREDLDSKKAELRAFKEDKDTLASTIKHSFSDDGAITRAGLETELLRLDVLRRSEDPLDGRTQSLIQGQQNEIAHLLGMESTLLREKENILTRINELENETQALIDGLQKRGKNDAS